MGEFIESLKFTCLTPKSILEMLSLLPVDRHRAVKHLSHLMCKFPG